MGLIAVLQCQVAVAVAVWQWQFPGGGAACGAVVHLQRIAVSGSQPLMTHSVRKNVQLNQAPSAARPTSVMRVRASRCKSLALYFEEVTVTGKRYRVFVWDVKQLNN